MRQVLSRLIGIQLRANLDRTGSTIRGHRLYYSALASSVSPPRSSAPIANVEFDEEIERELARLPAKRAQEARRRLRNERRAEINGQSMGRKDSVIIPYIPPYEGPDPNSSRGLWTHLKVGWQKNRLKEAWGQWLGQRQSKQNVDSVLSPGNPSWMKDFVDEAYGTIILAHQTVTSGSFEDPQVKKFLHPSMVDFLREKRERLLRSYSPSHLITWTKHAPAPEAGKKGKQAQPEKELEIVAMRAAPFDQGGTVVQIAVRFKSLQSLEIRDERGLLVFGSHSKPQPIMEKRMGQVDQSFRLLQQVDEDTKPDCLPV